ncbi:MAG: RHS repeat-associated core domain-containing protein [Oscillospiraceae bacterium]|nr:RHS repeat-associated core domain-containing protein [Oscillospiraceae bacterium]
MYVITNRHGDVLGLYDYAGRRKVSYEYDAWGNTVSVTDTSQDNWSTLNPFRYRGYYFDTETGLYYLLSRYYDPAVGRFINADGYVSTGTGILGFNVFAYCNNSPIIFSDDTGTRRVGILEKYKDSGIGWGTQDRKSGTNSSSTASEYIPTPQVKSYAATVYAEAGGQNKRSKQAVAHVMYNRIGLKSSWTDIEAVISADCQFDGYNTSLYQAAMNYYNTGICDNSIEKASMDECLAVVIPIYRGEEADITGGALYFNSFANPSDWTFYDSYTQVYVSGVDDFWFYK